MAENYDITIIGSGPSGAFATYKLAKSNTKQKVCLIEFGKPPGKRRKQMEGWFGCFMSSNLRFYTRDMEQLNAYKSSTSYYNEFLQCLKSVSKLELSKNKEPSEDIIKLLIQNQYTFDLNPHYQLYSEHIHLLSRTIAEVIEPKTNITCKFDTECLNVRKTAKEFVIETEYGEFNSKKVVICAGRSGWRFAHKVFKNLDININNNKTSFGARVELPVSCVKSWNTSHCTLKKDDIVLGPLSWNGTIIPEDHDDLVITNWRSNEDRWKTEKLSFSLTKTFDFKDNGKEQAERLSKLAFVLSDNRVGKYRIKEFNDSCDINKLPEYDWLKPKLTELKCIFPQIIEKGFIHMPEVITYNPEINVSNKLETNIKDLYVAGESAGITGLLGSAISGLMVADNCIGD